MGASTLLRAARHSSGLHQGEVARRANTSQSDISFVERGRRIPTTDTLERLLNSTGHRLIAVRTNRADAVETAERISSALRDKSVDVAFRRFLDYSDGLSATDGVDRVILAVAEPFPTGSRLWDTALAAVAEFWLDEARLPRPSWLDDPSRTLTQPEALAVSEYDLEPDPAQVPAQFLKRNLLIERGTLASV